MKNMKFIKRFLIPFLYPLPIFYELFSHHPTLKSINTIYGIGVLFFVLASLGMIWSKSWFKMYSKSGFTIKLKSNLKLEIWNLENVFLVFACTLGYAFIGSIDSWIIYYLFAFGLFFTASVRVFRISSKVES